MKKYSLLLPAFILLTLLFSCNSNKTDKATTSTGKFSTGNKAMDKKLDMDCTTPVLTATVNGNHYFKSCNADAHLILGWLNFFGTAENDILAFNITAPLNGVTPGTYKISKGFKKFTGQNFSINGGIFLNGDKPKHNHESIDGSMTFTIADGKRFKGTFEMTVEKEETKEILKITDGTFDLLYNAKGDKDLNKLKIKKKANGDLKVSPGI